MVESSAGVPVPIVYPAVADRIGLLKSEAMDVVIVYQLIEIGRDGADQLIRHRTPDDIPVVYVSAVADAFLEACLYARAVLPRLRTGMALQRDSGARHPRDVAARGYGQPSIDQQ